MIFFNSFAGHQRINLPVATVLMPAGKAKETTQRASRQIADEIQAKLLIKSLKNWTQRIFMDPTPGFLFPEEDSLPLNTQWSFETVLEDAPAGFGTLGWGRFQAFGQPVDSAGSHLWVVAWAALQSTVGTRVVWGLPCSSCCPMAWEPRSHPGKKYSKPNILENSYSATPQSNPLPLVSSPS